MKERPKPNQMREAAVRSAKDNENAFASLEEDMKEPGPRAESSGARAWLEGTFGPFLCCSFTDLTCDDNPEAAMAACAYGEDYDESRPREEDAEFEDELKAQFEKDMASLPTPKPRETPVPGGGLDVPDSPRYRLDGLEDRRRRLEAEAS